MGKQGEPIGWITVRGNHVPIFEGQSKSDAIKAFAEKQKQDKIATNKMAKKYVGEHTVYRTGNLDAPRGMVYLSTDKREASHYGESKDKMDEYKINIKNPLVVDARTYSNSDLEGTVKAYVALGGKESSVNWEREGEQERLDKAIAKAIKKTDYDSVIIHKRNGSVEYYEIQVPKKNIGALQFVKSHSKRSEERSASKQLKDSVSFYRYVEKTGKTVSKNVVDNSQGKTVKGVASEIVKGMKKAGFQEAEYKHYSGEPEARIWGRMYNSMLEKNWIYMATVVKLKNGKYKIEE